MHSVQRDLTHEYSDKQSINQLRYYDIYADNEMCEFKKSTTLPGDCLTIYF